MKKGSNTDTYSYEYDDYGNRSKMTATGTEEYETVYDYSVNGKYTALLQKEVKTIEKESNLIDLNSNVKQTVYTYDANGNQIKKTSDGKTETNTYNGLNQLIGFTDGETIASYKYNASGLRYEKTVDGQTINHVWDGNQQVIADIIDNQFYEADCYIRGTNLVAKYNFWNGKKSEYTYYTQNAHGDVVNLTDKDGKVTKSYRYDAFGVEKNIDNRDTNAFRYCGEYFDKETATVYLRARNYNPSTGRFISRDSYAGNLHDPLSLNLYTYCANNPIKCIDPSGHIIFGFDVFFGTDIVVDSGLKFPDVSIPNAPNVDVIPPTVIDAESVKIEISGNQSLTKAKESEKEVEQKKKNKYYIYVLVDNGGYVQYVGQTNNPIKRRSQHRSSSNRGHLHFKQVYGMEFSTRLEARFAEQAGIEYFNTLNKVRISSEAIKNPRLRQNNQRNEISPKGLLYPIYEKIFKEPLISKFKSYSELKHYKSRKKE